MNNLRLTVSMVLGLTLLWTGLGLAQNNGPMHDGPYHPDSLEVVTVSGVAIVDTTYMHPLYFLDEDGNGEADYQLNFGPFWYEPDSGNAVRPADGETITIEGGLVSNGMQELPVIVVYTINDEFWRDPLEPYWNNFGGHHHGGNGHQGGCQGYAGGWMTDSLQTVELNGTALVDTTFYFAHYYLDENGDTIPDYFLNFGPPWYEPESGASRPENGDQITITGWLMPMNTQSMVIVLEINGLTWRDSTLFGPHLGGGWMHSNMDSSMTFHAPYDEEDWMTVQPGWHGGMGHHGGGGMMPDSLFAQILELFPENMPEGPGNHGAFAAYEIGMFQPDGANAMWSNGNCGGHMEFNNNIQMQFHYNDIQIMGNNIDENSISLKYWDENSLSWQEVSNAQLNPETNTITFSSNEVNNFYILTGEQSVTAIDSRDATIVNNFSVIKNFPNPFNPGTTIQFTLEKPARIQLRVYNVLGQLVKELARTDLSTGTHSFYFDAANLPTGIYFVELQIDNQKLYHKIQLIK